jgi:hypothetical protein
MEPSSIVRLVCVPRKKINPGRSKALDKVSNGTRMLAHVRSAAGHRFRPLGRRQHLEASARDRRGPSVEDLVAVRDEAEEAGAECRLRRKLGVEPVSAQESQPRRASLRKAPGNLSEPAAELSSPPLPADARTEFETKIVAGSRFIHIQI